MAPDPSALIAFQQRFLDDASETAKLLGVEASTVIDWAKRGGPVAARRRVGRNTGWVFDVASLEGLATARLGAT